MIRGALAGSLGPQPLNNCIMKKLVYDLVTEIILPCVIKVEKEIFFLTGCKLPILAAYWRHKSQKLQKSLDIAHAFWFYPPVL